MFNSRFLQDVGAFVRGLGRKADELSEQGEIMEANIGLALGAAAYPFVVTTGSNGRAIVDYSALGLIDPPGAIVITPEMPEDQLPVSFDIVGAPTATQCTVRARRLTSVLSLGLLSSYSAVSGVKLRVVIRPAAQAQA